MLTKWQTRFVKLAYEVSTWSKDPDCAVGAVVVSPDMSQLSYGYNGFPRGIADTPHRLGNKEVKNRLTVHAEVNAIVNAARDLRGWTLYCTKTPCHNCAAAIIQARISEVVVPKPNTASRWFNSNLAAIGMFKEGGINVVLFEPSDMA